MAIWVILKWEHWKRRALGDLIQEELGKEAGVSYSVSLTLLKFEKELNVSLKIKNLSLPKYNAWEKWISLKILALIHTYWKRICRISKHSTWKALKSINNLTLSFYRKNWGSEVWSDPRAGGHVVHQRHSGAGTQVFHGQTEFTVCYRAPSLSLWFCKAEFNNISSRGSKPKSRLSACLGWSQSLRDVIIFQSSSSSKQFSRTHFLRVSQAFVPLVYSVQNRDNKWSSNRK